MAKLKSVKTTTSLAEQIHTEPVLPKKLISGVVGFVLQTLSAVPYPGHSGSHS